MYDYWLYNLIEPNNFQEKRICEIRRWSCPGQVAYVLDSSEDSDEHGMCRTACNSERITFMADND